MINPKIRWKIGILMCLIFMTVIFFQYSCTEKQATDGDVNVNVLAILPLSGKVGSYGQHVRQGIELFKRDNPSSKLKIRIEDSKSSPADGVAILAQSSALDKPNVVVSANSDVSGAVIPKAESEGIFTAVTMTSAESILKDRLGVQRFYPTSNDITTPIVFYAKKRYRTAAILYSDNEYGLANRDTFIKLFENDGRSITTAESFNIVDTDLIKTHVLKVISGNPESLYVAGYGPAYLEVFKALRALDYKGQIFADESLGLLNNIEKIGTIGENIIFSGMEFILTDPENEEVKSFNLRYKEIYNEQADHMVSCSYEMMSIIDRMVELGVTFSQESFKNLGEWKGKVMDITFLDNGECHIPMIAILRKNGKNIMAE